MYQYTTKYFNNHQNVYTNVSKSDKNVGITIINDNNNITFKLPKEYSFYSVEVLAILITKQLIIDNEYTKFIILSDSISAMNGIKDKTDPSHIAILIKNKPDEAKISSRYLGTLA